MSEQDYFKKDYYKVLGLTKNATDKEIKQAFRKLSRKWHPDQNPGDKNAEAKFKEISEAHTVLGNANERQKYDQIRAMAGGGPRFTTGGGGFEDLFGGGFSHGGAQYSTSSHGMGGGFDGLSDILGGLFGGGGMGSQGMRGGFGGQNADPFGQYSSHSNHQSQNAPAPKPTVDKKYTISFKNAVFGATVKHKTKTGEEVKFKVPAGTVSGKKFKVKGETIQIDVKIPDATKLSEKDQTTLKTALDLLK